MSKYFNQSIICIFFLLFSFSLTSSEEEYNGPISTLYSYDFDNGQVTRVEEFEKDIAFFSSLHWIERSSRIQYYNDRTHHIIDGNSIEHFFCEEHESFSSLFILTTSGDFLYQNVAIDTPPSPEYTLLYEHIDQLFFMENSSSFFSFLLISKIDQRFYVFQRQLDNVNIKSLPFSIFSIEYSSSVHQLLNIDHSFNYDISEMNFHNFEPYIFHDSSSSTTTSFTKYFQFFISFGSLQEDSSSFFPFLEDHVILVFKLEVSTSNLVIEDFSFELDSSSLSSTLDSLSSLSFFHCFHNQTSSSSSFCVYQLSSSTTEKKIEFLYNQEEEQKTIAPKVEESLSKSLTQFYKEEEKQEEEDRENGDFSDIFITSSFLFLFKRLTKKQQIFEEEETRTKFQFLNVFNFKTKTLHTIFVESLNETSSSFISFSDIQIDEFSSFFDSSSSFSSSLFYFMIVSDTDISDTSNTVLESLNETLWYLLQKYFYLLFVPIFVVIFGCCSIFCIVASLKLFCSFKKKMKMNPFHKIMNMNKEFDDEIYQLEEDEDETNDNDVQTEEEDDDDNVDVESERQQQQEPPITTTMFGEEEEESEDDDDIMMAKIKN